MAKKPAKKSRANGARGSDRQEQVSESSATHGSDDPVIRNLRLKFLDARNAPKDWDQNKASHRDFLKRVEMGKTARARFASLEEQDAWVRADTASRNSNLDAGTIRKRAHREGWEIRKAGSRNVYKLADLQRAWPDRRFSQDNHGM